jgi:hypothetical protein
MFRSIVVVTVSLIATKYIARHIDTKYGKETDVVGILIKKVKEAVA